MPRKTTLLVSAAAAVVALVAPAAANAQLLTSDGVVVPVGRDITATSNNAKTTTSSGTIECVKVTNHFEVTANGANRSAMQSTSVTTEGCVLNVIIAKIPVTITSASTAFELAKGGAGNAPITFVSDIEGSEGTETCHFEGEAGIAYEGGTNKVETEGLLAGSGEGCPEAMLAEGTFELETVDGTPVTIDT